MMATTVESHTPLLKGSRKERRLGGAFIVIMMIVIVIIVKTVIMIVIGHLPRLDVDDGDAKVHPGHGELHCGEALGGDGEIRHGHVRLLAQHLQYSTVQYSTVQYSTEAMSASLLSTSAIIPFHRAPSKPPYFPSPTK